jgi:hypothetical protein
MATPLDRLNRQDDGHHILTLRLQTYILMIISNVLDHWYTHILFLI